MSRPLRTPRSGSRSGSRATPRPQVPQVFELTNQIWSEEDPERAYYARPASERTTLHFGQLKLLLCEILFMTLYWDPAEIPHPTFVSVGAAEGYHFPTFIELFQVAGSQFEYHLYDPRDFTPTLSGMKNVHLYQKYFDDTDAERWAGRDDVIFICDIRNNSTSTPYPTEADIRLDLSMQLRWYWKVRPRLCLFKFRPPYYRPGEPREWTYLDGQVFYQTYAGQSSTETRLVPRGFDASGQPFTRTYDLEKYENQLFYLNSVLREQAVFQDPVDRRKTYGWDEASEIMILRMYYSKLGEDDLTFEEIQTLRQKIREQIHDHGDELGASPGEDLDYQAAPPTAPPARSTRRVVRAPGRRVVNLSPEKSRPVREAAGQVTPQKPARK